jgi:hypothetical protein
MPHTFSAGERTAVQSTRLSQRVKMEIQDPDLNWVDVSTQLSSPDWFNSATVSDSIDANTMSFQASLLRDTTTLSLAPFRTDSVLNRDSTTTYSPMLDLVRMWRLSVSVVAAGDSASYNEIAKGYIDSIDVDDLSPTITITGRGEEAPLLDCEILEIRTYSTGSTASMEEVIQQLLDDNLEDPPTLYVPTPSDFTINEYQQDFGNLMNAIQGVAALVGGLVRYFYDSAGTNRLTLYFPNREAEPGDEDWTIAATEYSRLPLNRIEITGVRNYISIRYNDAALEDVNVVVSPVGGVSDSTIRYKRRSLPIDLAPDTQIMTEAQAQELADAIRSDLEFPSLLQRFQTYGFWFVQIGDYGKMTANDVHYNEDQYGGVTAFSHEMVNGVIRTTVDLGALPSGGYKRWIPIGRFPPKGPIQPPGGPTDDPVLPPFNPEDPDEGAPATSVVGKGRIGIVGLGSGNSGTTVGPGGTGTVVNPGACVSALSGLAGADYQMGLCDVATTAEVVAYSSQQTGTLLNVLQSPEVAGERMAHCYGVTLTADVSSANYSQHLLLYDRTADPDWVAAAQDSQSNIKALFPAEDHMDFWVRCLFKNLTPQPAPSVAAVISFGTQWQQNDVYGVYVNSNDDNKLYVYTAGGHIATGDEITALTPELFSTDLVDVMWHWELSNPTSMAASAGIKYDYTMTLYWRINNGLPDSRVFTGTNLSQHYFNSVAANGLTPFALNILDQQAGAINSGEAAGVEIHGWEFVESSTDTDPFNVEP